MNRSFLIVPITFAVIAGAGCAPNQSHANAAHPAEQASTGHGEQGNVFAGQGTGGLQSAEGRRQGEHDYSNSMSGKGYPMETTDRDRTHTGGDKRIIDYSAGSSSAAYGHGGPNSGSPTLNDGGGMDATPARGQATGTPQSAQVGSPAGAGVYTSTGTDTTEPAQSKPQAEGAASQGSPALQGGTQPPPQKQAPQKQKSRSTPR